MIKAKDAIKTARGLLGTPYSTYDCIGLIVQVIRRSPGGVSDYRCQGTNWLWDSADNSGKYKHLTERYESLKYARAGMLAFKCSGEDVHHVGLVTGEGTVIHSSSTQGGRGVVETPLTAAEGWELLGKHRYITPSTAAAVPLPQEGGFGANEREVADMESYKARVVLRNPDSTLNVRNEPGTGGDIIGRLGHGAEVTVQAAFDNGWVYASYGDSGLGYLSGEYLQRVEDEPAQTENVITVSGEVTIIDDAGNTFKPVGGWRVLLGAVD